VDEQWLVVAQRHSLPERLLAALRLDAVLRLDVVLSELLRLRLGVVLDERLDVVLDVE
jgi:hypothetical protein